MEETAAWKPPAKTDLVSADYTWKGRVQHVGASILPFMVDGRHKLVYFLLGRECPSLAWAEGSDRIDSFGGAPNKSDRDPEETAAREFVEETLGVVRFFETDSTRSPRTKWGDIAASLRKGQFLRKIETSQPNGKEKGVISVYTTFVVPLPWDP